MKYRKNNIIVFLRNRASPYQKMILQPGMKSCTRWEAQSTNCRLCLNQSESSSCTKSTRVMSKRTARILKCSTKSKANAWGTKFVQSTVKKLSWLWSWKLSRRMRWRKKFCSSAGRRIAGCLRVILETVAKSNSFWKRKAISSLRRSSRKWIATLENWNSCSEYWKRGSPSSSI